MNIINWSQWPRGRLQRDSWSFITLALESHLDNKDPIGLVFFDPKLYLLPSYVGPSLGDILLKTDPSTQYNHQWGARFGTSKQHWWVQNICKMHQEFPTGCHLITALAQGCLSSLLCQKALSTFQEICRQALVSTQSGLPIRDEHRQDIAFIFKYFITNSWTSVRDLV